MLKLGIYIIFYWYWKFPPGTRFVDNRIWLLIAGLNGTGIKTVTRIIPIRNNNAKVIKVE